MASLSLCLLGGFRAERNGEPITAFESNKVRALLAYLAVEATPIGRPPHQRSALAGLLWPDHSEEQARTNLRHVLRQLRQTLADQGAAAPLLLTSQHTIQMNPNSGFTLDVASFAALLAACKRCTHRALEVCPDCIERYSQAAALYRGAFLAGLDLPDSDLFGEWVVTLREQLHRQALEAFFTLAAYYEEAGDYEQACQYAWRELELEPWREEAHRQIMRVLARSGQRSSALAQYARCRTVLADALGVEPDAETVALYEQIRNNELSSENDQLRNVSAPRSQIPGLHSQFQDWGEAPATAYFYGRQVELAQVQRWLLEERRRLVLVLSMGGMGKTALVTKSARALAYDFDVVVWRSLLNAPLLPELLRTCLQALARPQLIQVPDSLSEQLTLLFDYLRRRRCLLVLDNFESLLEAGRAGRYRPGYEDYGQLIERVAQTEHQSCLVLTSRERPQGIGRLAEDQASVCWLQLDGLEQQAARALLETRGLPAGENLIAPLVERYSGNPLALKLMARTIQELFDGDIATFLSDAVAIFDDIRAVLDQQFARLSPLEREILVWLAIEREGVALHALQDDFVRTPLRRDLLEALRALQRRSLLEKTDKGFTLQNVVMEYVTDFVVDQCRQEIERGAIELLNRHVLLKAQAKEYVRQSQIRLLLAPVARWLVATLGQARLEARVRHVLATLRTDAPLAPGYAAGNLLNLLLHLDVDVTGYDFSHLCVWQAYLRGMYAPGIHFAGADLTGSAFTHMYGHIQGLQFGADGDLLVVGVQGSRACVWRAATGELLHAVPTQDPVSNWICLSSDGRIAALGGPEHTIVMVDIIDRRVLHRLAHHHSPIWRLVFSFDGRWLASGDGSGQVCVWAVESGRLLSCLQIHTAQVTALAFAPVGDLVACGAADGSVALWRPASKEQGRIWHGHADEVAALAFVSGGTVLATGSHDHTVRLWDVASGALVRILGDHTQPVRFLAVDQAGRNLASSGGDSFIALRNVQTDQPRYILSDHAAPIGQMTFRADGRMVAALDINETIGVWDVPSGQRIDFYRIHHSGIQAISFSPTGQLLVSGGADWAVYIWDVGVPADAHVIARLPGHKQRIESVVFSPDGTTVASGDQGGGLLVWDIDTRRNRALHGHQGSVTSLAFSPDGRVLASASADGTLRLWDVVDGRVNRVLHGHTNMVYACAFSPDGRYLASGSMDRTVCIWDAQTGTLLQTMRGHSNIVQQVSFCRDPRYLITSSFDQTMRLWDVHTGQLLETWPTQNTTYLSLAIHPERDIVAAGGHDHIIRLVDVATGRVLSALQGHSRTVEAVSFHADGRLLASASHDETIKIWAVASEEALLGSEGCLATLHAPGPYVGMNITGVIGITDSQKATLLALGAVEDDSAA